MGPFGGFNPFQLMKGMNPLNLQSQMKDMMGKNMPFDPEAMFGNMMNPPQSEPLEEAKPYNVFETHDDVYIRIPINADEINPKSIKVFYTSNKATIKNYPEENEQEIITLPCTVKRTGGKAAYRDGILEVRMVKDWDHHYTEIDIRL
ncbi:Hsp20/alpha crystallin family protein [Bacillus sp. 2205SS5-2]|uniref:Hsp20/alpha crystallin family protein n=1 Tax=Bacillus sp. 2205SS5-2 TaxID=3109031 RepID=UPI003007A8AA